MILPYAAIAILLLTTVYSAIVSFSDREGRTPSWIFPNTASRSVRKSVGILTAALLIVLGAWIGTTATKPAHRSSRFLIPEGYTGWVRVEFEVQGAPPLPIEDGQYVLRIPDGVLRTSSQEQYGWTEDHYYYYSAQNIHPIPDSGPSGLIWGKLNGEATDSSGKRKYEEFFVGTNEQFKEEPK